MAPVSFGRPGDVAIIGDWDNDSVDEVGVYRSSVRTFFFGTDEGTQLGHATYGASDVLPVPVIGDWDGDGQHSQGVIQ